MPFIVELTGVDLNDNVEKTVKYSLGGGLALSDAAYIPGALVRWKSPTLKVDISSEGGVVQNTDAGELVLSNTPTDIRLPGPLDALANAWAWHGRRASLYYTADTWANRVLLSAGVLEQPIAPMITEARKDANLVFPLRDPRKAYDRPLQPTKYLGTNLAGAGVEGEEDLKGKPKPILYGVVSNIPGVKVNRQKLIWQISDKAATVLCVRDGGAPLTVGIARANVASLEANTPTPGTYDYTSTATGTYVRLGTTPIFTLTMDAQEGANAAARTHAQIWKRLRTERCGNVVGDLDAASITAVDALDANEVGWWWPTDKTQFDAIREVLSSLSGFEVLDFASKWEIKRLIAPAGTPSYEFRLLLPETVMKTNERAIGTCGRARPNYAPEGAPPYRIKVEWGRNHTVMDEPDFAGVVKVNNPRLVEKFAESTRTEVANNNAIWNPDTQTGPWPNAPEMLFSTAYQPGADGLTCPHALAEAQRLMTLLTPLRTQYQLGYRPEVTDQVQVGDIMKLTHPQFSLTGGVLFVVLQASWQLDAKGLQAGLVLGFGEETITPAIPADAILDETGAAVLDEAGAYILED